MDVVVKKWEKGVSAKAVARAWTKIEKKHQTIGNYGNGKGIGAFLIIPTLGYLAKCRGDSFCGVFVLWLKIAHFLPTMCIQILKDIMKALVIISGTLCEFIKGVWRQKGERKEFRARRWSEFLILSSSVYFNVAPYRAISPSRSTPIQLVLLLISTIFSSPKLLNTFIAAVIFSSLTTPPYSYNTS